MAWRDSLRLRPAMNNVLASWLLAIHVIAARRTGRAVLLTLAGWTSSKIAEAFGVREDTVRLWRSNFSAGGVAALKASIAQGPPP
jgi:Winged helix-turn helix